MVVLFLTLLLVAYLIGCALIDLRKVLTRMDELKAIADLLTKDAADVKTKLDESTAKLVDAEKTNEASATTIADLQAQLADLKAKAAAGVTIDPALVKQLQDVHDAIQTTLNPVAGPPAPVVDPTPAPAPTQVVDPALVPPVAPVA